MQPTIKDLTKNEKKLLQKWIVNIGGFAKAIIFLTKEHDRAWAKMEEGGEPSVSALNRVDKMAKSIDYVRVISKFGLNNLLCLAT